MIFPVFFLKESWVSVSDVVVHWKYGRINLAWDHYFSIVPVVSKTGAYVLSLDRIVAVIWPHFVAFDTCHIDNANVDDGVTVHCGVSFGDDYFDARS